MSIVLPNGCHIGAMSVHPKNWEDPDTALNIEWYIHYRFHHPSGKVKFPKGYQVKIRRMNDADGLQEKRRITRQLLANEMDALKNGYNPIPASFGISFGDDLQISPYTGFIAALQAAYKLLKPTSTKNRMKNALPHFEKAAGQLQFDDMPVTEIRQRHLEVLLMKVTRNKEDGYDEQRKNLKPGQKPPPDEWGYEAFNHYRAYLQMLFKILKKVGANEAKPVDDIEKRTGIKKPRFGYTETDFQKIERLKKPYYTFWRFIHIFFQSGSREKELMALQKHQVDMPGRRFLILVKKGRGGWEWVWKTIMLDVLPLWQEIMADANDGDFIFSHDLRPGPAQVSARQITIRWKKYGKDELGIKADFYELKHQFTTTVINMALRKIDDASKVAAKINGHKSTKMNDAAYDLEAGDRLHRELSR